MSYAPGQEHIEAELSALAAAIEPGARACGAAVRARLSEGAGLAQVELAARLAEAQHRAAPVIERRCVVMCAGDHGVAARVRAERQEQALAARGQRPPRALPMAPRAGDAEDDDTGAMLRSLAGGRSALHAAAGSARTAVLLVDCGTASAQDSGGAHAITDLRIGDGTADITRGPAMSRLEAALSVRTGVALLLSLAEDGIDIVALGHCGAGARAATSAVIAALAELPGDALDEVDQVPALEARAANADALAHADALAVLACLGGFEIGVLTGVILGAASLRIPLVLDDHGTAAAALLAARWQPAIAGYLLAAHPGSTRAHRAALRALALTPVFEQSLGRGEGTAAALALNLLDAAVQAL